MLMRLSAVVVLSAVALACADRSADDTRNSSPLAPTSITVATAGAPSSASGPAPLSAQGQAADTSTDTQHFETTGEFINPCNGDTVAVAGTFNIIIHTTVNGNTVQLALHQTGRATGTSQTTGIKYIWNNSLQYNERAALENGVAVLDIVEHNRFIALGSATGFNAKLLIHITVNANGDVTAGFQIVTEGCVG